MARTRTWAEKAVLSLCAMRGRFSPVLIVHKVVKWAGSLSAVTSADRRLERPAVTASLIDGLSENASDVAKLRLNLL